MITRDMLIFNEIGLQVGEMIAYNMTKARNEEMLKMLEDESILQDEFRFMVNTLKTLTNIGHDMLDDDEFMRGALENPSPEFEKIVLYAVDIAYNSAKNFKQKLEMTKQLPEEEVKKIIEKTLEQDDEYKQWKELNEKFGK